MRTPDEFPRDILEAVANIERYAARCREAFEQEELIQVWMVHHLQRIGEAAGQLGRTFHDEHPELPWPRMFDRIKAAMMQSRTLAALRDALLPKLICGELRVPDAERIVGRAS